MSGVASMHNSNPVVTDECSFTYPLGIRGGWEVLRDSAKRHEIYEQWPTWQATRRSRYVRHRYRAAQWRRRMSAPRRADKPAPPRLAMNQARSRMRRKPGFARAIVLRLPSKTPRRMR